MSFRIRKHHKELDHNLATGIDRFFISNDPGDSGLQLVRSNRNREVYLVKMQNQIYYVKRFFSTSTREKIKNIILYKAFNSFRLSHRLMSTGFLVAEPVLAFRCHKKGEGVYVTKKLTGFPLNEFLSFDIPEVSKEKALNQFVITIANLFKNGFLHCDPTLSNFLISEKNDHYEIGLVDLDAIIQLPRPIDTLTYKNLAKLYARSPILWEYRDELEEQNYLKTFIRIYNHRLDPVTVRKRIGRMIAKRMSRLAS